MGFQTKKVIFGNIHNKAHIIRYLQIVIFVLLLSEHANWIKKS